MNFKKVFLLILLSCVTIFGLGQNSNSNVYVDSLMKKLSVREKVAQLFVVDVSSLYPDAKQQEALKLIKEDKVGGIIIMVDSLRSSFNFVNDLHKNSKIPLLVCVDGEWGAAMRFRELLSFPKQMQLGALNNDSLIYKMGNLVGQECKALNIHINFAPCIDINNNPDNPVINARSFGEDKYKVAKYGRAYLAGMRDAGVFGSLKHFPGHGDTDVDSHIGLPILPYNLERLDSLELYPFKQIIADSADIVMVGHLEVPAIDSSGRPSSISKDIIKGYLKGKMGFKGIVCTDALNMGGVAKSAGIESKFIPLEAYKAGVDIFLMARDVNVAINEITRLVKNGKLPKKELDEKVRKVLTLKYNAGVFNKDYSSFLDVNIVDSLIENPNNLELVKQIAKNSITLVHNDTSKSVIPIKGDKKIAYLGYTGERMAVDFAKVAINYANVDTIILRSPVQLSDLQKAKDTLKDYDLVITTFNNTDVRPQMNFGIDSLQLKFLTDWAAEKPMIGIYFGSPYALNKIPDYKNFKAFIVGYTNTLANNFAAAQVIFGAVNAKGVLPVGTDTLKVGYSIFTNNITREELFNFIDSKQDSLDRVKIALNSSSSLLYTLPQIGELIGKKLTGYEKLYTLLDNVNDEHRNLTILNLLLRDVDSSITDTLSAKYLNLIINKFAPDSNFSLVKKLCMRNTSSTNNTNFTTTKADMRKFWFMIKNNGYYGGEKILSNYTVKMLKIIYPLYPLPKELEFDN